MGHVKAQLRKTPAEGCVCGAARCQGQEEGVTDTPSAACSPPPRVLLPEAILHQHCVGGFLSTVWVFQLVGGNAMWRSGQDTGKWHKLRAACQAARAHPWVLGGGRGSGRHHCCSSARVLAGLKGAQCRVPGCEVSSACSHLPPLFSPLLQPPLSPPETAKSPAAEGTSFPGARRLEDREW